MDVQIETPAMTPADLSAPTPGEGSAQVAARVAYARRAQTERYAEEGATVRVNAAADGKLLEKVAAPDAAGKALLDQAAEKLRLSARGYHRVLRLARTIADLEGADGVGRSHIAEAASYRRAPITR